ncbi:MAG: hypothetical protein K2O88_05430 [Paramuribaculum sp.]|nr:hypothetical protein [Paramuribaculum sp.]
MIRTIITGLLCVLASVSVSAQQLTEIGTWEVFPVFAPPAQKVIDTGSKVYYQSGGNLFEYDPKSDESYSYTRQNKLNGFEVSNIYYNYDENYLLIIYDDGNMDVLYPSGKVVNMSDLSDSEITRPLKVNDVAFAPGKMYLATSFGVVEYNMSRNEVVQSGVWNRNVGGIEVMNGRIVMEVEGEGLMTIPMGENFATVNALTFISEMERASEIKAVDDTHILLKSENLVEHGMLVLELDFESNQCLMKRMIFKSSKCQPIVKNKNGVFMMANGYLSTLSSSYYLSLLCKLPTDIPNECATTYSGKNKIWSLNGDGLSCYGYGADGGLHTFQTRFVPEKRSVKLGHYLLPAADGRHLYAFNVGISRFKFTVAGASGYYTPLSADLIDMGSGEAKPLAPYPVEASNPKFISYQKSAGKYILSPSSFCGDPDDINTYYVGSNGDGLYKITNGEVVGYYGPENSPLETIDNRWIVYGVSIDRGGNLWMVTNNNNNQSNSIWILPADKRALPADEVMPEDWYSPGIPNNVGHMDFRMLHCKRSNMIFLLDASPANIVLAYDTRGTFNDFTDDQWHVWSSFVDQDGISYAPSDQYAIVEDHNGKVWLGTNQGVVEISNPSQATNPSMRINHLKVPRNDGTNDADYLLGSSTVTDIAVDAANRKWVSTAESGLFLVSAQGNAILEHYGSDNSMLPSDYVNSVYADPMSNYLYVGTDNGVMRLSTNASPAMDSYDDIYAYPNPVRPEHRGPVYVKGLMENSLVKITDMVGNIVHQGMSDGGLFKWDATDRTGRRVRTGVYNVYVSQSSEDSSAGAVTKILVVN